MANILLVSDGYGLAHRFSPHHSRLWVNSLHDARVQLRRDPGFEIIMIDGILRPNDMRGQEYGRDLFLHLKDKKIAWIMLSHDLADRYEREAGKPFADANIPMLTKPIDPDTLEEAVAAALRRLNNSA